MRVFNVYMCIYIYSCSENVPRQTFLSPGQRNVEKPWPVFSAFLFFTNPILYSFSQYPPFFPPRPLRALFLRAFCRWWMEKVKTWPVSTRGWKARGCLARVRSRGCERWSVNFQKRLPVLRANRVCPPPSPSFLLAREWTHVHALSIHYSHPSLLCSPVWTKENRIMPIFLVHRYLKFSVGRIIKPQSASSVKAAMRGGNTLESIIPGRINKNWTDGPIKHVKQPTLFH